MLGRNPYTISLKTEILIGMTNLIMRSCVALEVDWYPAHSIIMDLQEFAPLSVRH